MNVIDVSNIVLNENAYFYKRKKRIVANDILTLFKQCLDDKSAKRTYTPILRQSLFEGSVEMAKYSLLIFEYTQKPSFLKEPTNLWENKTGVFLILEHGEYLAVLRKNVSGIFNLKKLIEEIDYSILANFKVEDRSRFEKIVSNNLNTAENAIQTKTSEALDLKGVMSRFGISKQILSAVRLDNDGEKSSISLGTSRVSSLNIRGDFEPVLFWMVKTIKLIDKAYRLPRSSSFISGFAKPVEFEKEIKNLQPKFLFFRFYSIKDELDSGLISECYSLDEQGEKIVIDLLKIIEDNSTIFELTGVDNKTFKSDEITIRVNKKSISVKSPTFEGIYLEFEDGNPISLQEYINHKSHFIVTFDKPEFAYTHRKIFKDHKLLEDLDIFMETFISDPLLTTVTSEKGVGYTAASTSFTTDSIFGYLEEKFIGQVDCMICDDMGVEWGDHISIHQDEICFYHCKHDNLGLSASKLEVIFGQAQKNLGFLELTDEMVEYRRQRWTSNYAEPSIPRIRKCVTNGQTPIESVKNSIQKASMSGNLKRSVFIVINFLSKAQLTEGLGKVKNGETFHHKGVTLQILWFVNSLLSTANELNVQLRIICQP
jgi:hypothetical protein